MRTKYISNISKTSPFSDKPLNCHSSHKIKIQSEIRFANFRHLLIEANYVKRLYRLPAQHVCRRSCLPSRRPIFPYHVLQAKVSSSNKGKVKGKAIPFTGLDRTWGFQEVEAPRFQNNRHMKVVRLSALGTSRLYSSGNIPGTHFCWWLS